MTIATLAKPKKAPPLLFEGLTWREFKAVEQLLDRPGYRLFFLDGILEIKQMPGETHETVKERLGALLELYLLMAGFDFWFQLQAGEYVNLQPDAAGVIRSQVFSGLWLDQTALLAGNMQQVLAVLQAGINSAEHQAFVQQLAD